MCVIVMAAKSNLNNGLVVKVISYGMPLKLRKLLAIRQLSVSSFSTQYTFSSYTLVVIDLDLD